MLPRNTVRYGQQIHEYSSLENFYRQRPQTGIITINYGGHPLDLLHVDRGYETTIVVFHAALVGSKIKSLPLFSGLGITKDLPANLICVADPSLRFGIELGWFAGNSDQPLQRDLPNILRHLLSHYPSPQQLLFFGSSGGGFASLFYGHGFPSSTIVASNPQLRLTEYNESVVNAYIQAAWGINNLNTAPFFHDMNKLYSGGLSSNVLILQNAWDGHHRDRHLAPWIRSLPRNLQTLYLLIGDWGRGHAPPDTETLKTVLAYAISGSFEALPSLGFEKAPSPSFTGQRVRELRETQIQN